MRIQDPFIRCLHNWSIKRFHARFPDFDPALQKQVFPSFWNLPEMETHIKCHRPNTQIKSPYRRYVFVKKWKSRAFAQLARMRHIDTCITACRAVDTKAKPPVCARETFKSGGHQLPQGILFRNTRSRASENRVPGQTQMEGTRVRLCVCCHH